MLKRRTLSNKVCAVAMSGALALAFAPAATVPEASAATTTDSSLISVMTVETAVSTIQSALERNTVAADADTVVQLYEDVIVAKGGQDALTNDQLVYVLSCESYKLKAAQNENTRLQKQVTRLQSKVTSSESQAIKQQSVSSVKAQATGMGKVTVSWKASSPVSGIRYQVTYGPKSGKMATKATKKTTLVLKKLKGNKTYSFQVRPFKKVNGKRVYGVSSKKVTAKVIPTYSTGTYTVKGTVLNIRQTAGSTSADDVVTGAPKGTKLKVTKLKVVKGSVWGQVSYRGRVGWVQMSYLKKA